LSPLVGVTRRRFLVTLALAAAALAGGTAWSRRAALSRWLVSVPLDDTPPGPLDDATVQVLLATTQTLLGDGIEPGHYEEYFRWRAEHLRGHRSLYVQFAAALDRAARGLGHPDFVRCPPDAKARILDSLRPVRGWRQASRAIVSRSTARYATHIVRGIFQMFASTDAWILSGYDSWPGQPRGLEAYRQPVGKS
jgi:hypothetical protein